MIKRDTCDIFCIAGEPSGDLHGASLIRALRDLDPSLKISGVAGPKMLEEKIDISIPMERLQVMGFTDVLCSIVTLTKTFYQVRRKILQKNPTVVLFIDYPGFNIRMARSLRNAGFKGKLIHYICPTVWAWGKQRIPIMAKNLDLLLTTLPFEPSCFVETRLDVKYVGHPLVTEIAKHQSIPHFHALYGLDPTKKILAIFPGSRDHELQRNLTLQLHAAQEIHKNDPNIEIVISMAHPRFLKQLSSLQKTLIMPEHHYDLMKHAHMAIATSGTVTLELALFGTPTVVNFAIGNIDTFIAQRLFRINLPYYALPNIIAEKMIYPELIGPNLTKELLSSTAKTLWFDEKKRETCQNACRQLTLKLGAHNAAVHAAFHIKQIFASSAHTQTS